MNTLHNQTVLKESRRQLRSHLTAAEAILWKALQRSQLEGRKFRRQHSVGTFILDFYCPAEKLAVELDGAAHFTNAGQAYDAERTQFLNQVGIQVIRFENQFVFSNLDSVLEEIKRHFTNQSPKNSPPC